MATKNSKAAAPAPVTPDEGEAVVADGGDDVETPLRKFSRELALRFPDRMIRRYKMPKSVRECREVFLIELTSRDEIEAAIMADALMSDAEKRSVRLSDFAERREAVRLSIVGMGKLTIASDPTSPIVYTHKNNDGEPLSEINDWPARAWSALHAFFGTINGVPTDELLEGLAGAATVGAFEPPTTATRASAGNGK